MSYYKDLREYLEALEKRDKLFRIKSKINKDTELMPLVRLQYRGLPEEQRKAFLFENLTGATGKRYNGSAAVGALAGSSEIYAIGMMCKPEELMERRTQAELHPIPPRLVSSGPAQEEVHLGESLLEHGGIDEFPIPISVPGYDAGPCATAPFWITKDPDSGIRNVGTYRAMPKSPTRTGIDWANMSRGAGVHWLKCRKRGVPLQAALVTGGPPCIGYVSVIPYPTDVDELTVAGGIARQAIDVVKCKTVDIEVPAYAEIVMEGEIGTTEREPEGPFGESIGFMCLTQPRAYFDIKCITHRKNPIWLAFISQFQPSEGSKIKQHGTESTIYKQLRYDLGMEYVQNVAFQETSDLKLVVIQVQRTSQDNVWRALEETAKHHPYIKMIVAVDDFVDPRDLDMVFWVVTHCSQPHRDNRTVTRPSRYLFDCSLASMPELERLREEENLREEKMPDSSVLLINGTIKWPYPPISLPKKEFMERALEIWREEGLPALKLREPWWGRDLGYWSEEDKEKAERAIKGEYCKTGEIQASQRKPIK